MEWELKKSLSELEIINSARDIIESVECSGTCGNIGGSGGGPMFIMDGRNGVSFSNSGGVPHHWTREILWFIVPKISVIAHVDKFCRHLLWRRKA